ncbi:hypothetical protein GLYMA_07G227900v4 [Glycine max]|uniref:RRM domain-containing protein n=2 Tax=Glycine subgen. Soja TaxID=1462606 RepID=A0A0R0JCQ6_SOYBN|nr:hypothetical protein GYH30_019286 [Glycine max]KRH50553.1 hypothetical protein GLYMA_07G227900v4 [Glycine max]RZC04219.1 hypothetical protein D0Y65_018707 [Glycine soja]
MCILTYSLLFFSICSRVALLKMFSPYGKIISEDFLWHTRGPKRGESHVRMQEAELAKEKMHGRLACGRPLVVRLAGDKCMLETTDRSTKAAGEGHKMHLTGWWCHGTNKSQCKNCRYKKQIEILRGGEF